MKEFEQIQLQLISNLCSAGIYYIPKALMERANDTASIDLLPFANKIFLIENNGRNYFVEQEPVRIHIMKKQLLLDENIYKLLELLETSQGPKTNFVLERYGTYVEGMAMMGKWFVEHVEDDILTITKDQRNAFVQQRDIFERHMQELNDRFFANTKQEVTTPEPDQAQNTVLTETLEQLKKLVLPKLELANVQLDVETKTESLSKSEKRKQHLNDLKAQAKREAERVLLVQVFKLKFKDVE